MLDLLRSADRELFLFINGLHNSFFDFLMYWASDRFVWIPFYLFLLLILIKEFGKKTWFILLLVSLMILVSDQVSSTIVKNAVHRLRPCHTPEIMDMVHLVNGVCGGTFGYFSSHASNTTALALFMILLLRDGATAQFALGYGFRVRRSVLFIFLAGYAVLVSYSRIYLGCHYPSDVFTGIAFGGLLSFIFAKIFFRFSGAKN